MRFRQCRPTSSPTSSSSKVGSWWVDPTLPFSCKQSALGWHFHFCQEQSLHWWDLDAISSQAELLLKLRWHPIFPKKAHFSLSRDWGGEGGGGGGEWVPSLEPHLVGPGSLHCSKADGDVRASPPTFLLAGLQPLTAQPRHLASPIWGPWQT